MTPQYTNTDDTQLDSAISTINESHPNDGEVMITGHLLHKGICVPRRRVHASIHRVDPERVAERKSKAIRRVYHVPHPNDVWHIDGNHKLIKWHFMVHGGVDGYSRLVTFLECHTNNRVEIVLSSFGLEVERYGLPKKVCSDHGGENIDVWRYMMTAHGHQQCVVVGSSTHNERIERFEIDFVRDLSCVSSVSVYFGVTADCPTVLLYNVFWLIPRISATLILLKLIAVSWLTSAKSASTLGHP